MGILSEISTETALLEEIQKNPGVVKTYLDGLLPSLLNFLLQVVIAVVILLIGSHIVKCIVRMVGKSMDRGHAETGVVTFVCSLVKYALYFLLVMIILSQFGVTTSSVVAVLGSAGLTLGLALQGSLSNFAGGVLILLLKPFVVGDYIFDNDSGKEGTVTAITIFYTRLVTIDNKTVVIPNGTLSNTCIVNYSHMDKRRIDLTFDVAYETNLGEAKQVLFDVVSRQTAVLPEEPVDIFVSDLKDSSVEMGIHVWVKNEDYWPARWKLIEDTKNALDANGIQIPFPQLDVQIKESTDREERC